jgi:tetratricopeptide (TPR) repeat protein
VITQTLWRQVLALVESNRGNHERAIELARKAVALAEATDGLNVQGNALCDLADVLDGAGRPGEAADARARALDRYTRKQNLPLAALVRAAL